MSSDNTIIILLLPFQSKSLLYAPIWLLSFVYPVILSISCFNHRQWRS